MPRPRRKPAARRPGGSDSRNWQTALHEAGHLVAALAHGGTVAGAFLYDETGGSVHGEAGTRLPRGSGPAAQRAVHLAGWGAEEIAQHYHAPRPDCPPRFVQRDHPAEPETTAFDADVLGLYEDAAEHKGEPIDWEGEKARLVVVLLKYWLTLLRIAARLYARGYLDEAAIMAEWDARHGRQDMRLVRLPEREVRRQVAEALK